MSDRFKAVYEKGVIRPLEPFAAAEGEVFDVAVDRTPSHRTPYEIMREIAATSALEGRGTPKDLARNHDRYIYDTDTHREQK